MSQLTSVLLVLLLLLLYHLAQAKDVPGITAREEDSNSSSSNRTLFGIIWGCISTTIICAWAAIHPNIAPREGPLKRTLRRLELMFWTIVAPEILPCWALNQLLAAITIRDVYNNGKGYVKKKRTIWNIVKGWFSLYEINGAPSPVWTVAHGHFLIMGGFHVVEPPEDENGSQSMETNTDIQRAPTIIEETKRDTENGAQNPEGRVTILTLEMLRKLVKDPEFEIRMTEEEVTDRSKGDALSKLIFITQSTWFILQCLGRRIQGLDLTQLELTTLALASLNGITFVLWWDKPLGAQAIVRVYLKRKLTHSERVVVSYRSERSEVIPKVLRFFENCVLIIRDTCLCQSDFAVVNLVILPFAILVLPFFPVVIFTITFFATVSDLVEGSSSSFPPDNTHVPTFYVPNHQYRKWFHTFLLLFLSAAFGGIHCSGWNYSFPTYTEQKLWRIGSLGVTVLPITTFTLAVIVDSIYPNLLHQSTLQLSVRVAGGFIVVLCAFAYVSARLLLIGLALSLLRHLPPTAFIAIDWTKYYPHIL